MFDGPGPRLFGLPPGADFPRAFLAGLEARMQGQPPEALARVEIWVNTQRMRRRLQDLLLAGPARLWPRIRLVTDLAHHPVLSDLPTPGSPLRRRLELAQLVRGLIDAAPDLAPRGAVFDLADSLSAVMDEMQAEGVAPGRLRNLDVGGLSANWERSLQFLGLVEDYIGANMAENPGAGGAQRLAADRVAQRWQSDPPEHPVLVAGSTGSRGPVSVFMQAVARLPQGAVVVPGFDFDMPGTVWAGLDHALAAEDHPQYRFRALADALGLPAADVAHWHPVEAPCPARNALVSLALRPAPVTDQWMEDGPKLADLAGATAKVTLIEAPDPRSEALALALILRQAAKDGTRAALITPDRTLSRQVTAALDRWGILPDDSAGTPLTLSPPGRFLRQVAALFGQRLTLRELLTLLKHPLTASAPAGRGDHLRWTRELELHLRRSAAAFPTGATLTGWADTGPEDGRGAWTAWLAEALDGVAQAGSAKLSAHVARHMALAERLAAGPAAEGSGALWAEEAGAKAQEVCTLLRQEAEAGGEMTPADYADLLTGLLQTEEVRSAVEPHPDIMIWGTLEARVQGADLVLLAGLTEGTWPATPAPDPWLNRAMRAEAGLLLPERQIGLSAHDFQQAIGAPRVILSRAVRDAEAPTVPARWLNRLTNLLAGLPGQGGPEALAEMRRRGAHWLHLAEALERPSATVDPAPRPAPRPPVADRPRQLSVTGIERLIRDPYAIYAEKILHLRALDPLVHAADAPLRGSVLHKVMERFLDTPIEPDPAAARARLLALAEAILAKEASWPAARILWRARLARAAETFVAEETERQAMAACIAREHKGAVEVPGGVTLTAKADRIDRMPGGRLILYDYKTGTPPTVKSMEAFDKQLLLEGCIAERGGFEDIPAAPVDHVAYVGLGVPPKTVVHMLGEDLLARTWDELSRLIAAYGERQQGYTARARLQKRAETTDYDLLSRYGEWDETEDPCAQDVGDEA